MVKSVMGRAGPVPIDGAEFDEAAYLDANPDIETAVANGNFASGLAHFEAFGRAENRRVRRVEAKADVRHFDDEFYLMHSPDIAAAVKDGHFTSGLHHYELHGVAEDRAKRFLPACEGVLNDRAEVVQPVKDYFSGVTIGLAQRPRHDGLIRVEIKGPGGERAVVVDTVVVEDITAIHVYWEPITPSRQVMFVITVTAMGAEESGQLLPFHIARGLHALIYSSPTADGAFPPGILLSPVTQCNLNCIHCVSRETRKTLSVMDDAAWAEIADVARDGHICRVQTDYSGDIFFNDLRHGGWLGKLLSLDIPYMIDTHGNTLTEDHIDRLLESRLLRINFSIDTLDPEDYPKIRKGGHLGEALDNVRSFMLARNARRPDIEVIFSLVIMQRNISSVEPALELAAQLGMSGVSTSFLHVHTLDMMEQSLMLARDGLADLFSDLHNRARQLGVSLWLPPLPVSTTPRRGHRPCSYPWESAVVLGNGDVMACNVPGTVMGNTRNSSLREVWNGQKFQDFRRRVNSDNPPAPCSCCPMLSYPNSFAAHVPGLPEATRETFEHRCSGGDGDVPQ